MSDEQKPTQPPFDGKPCPMCPVEIRNLAAVAHNLISQLDRKASECKIAETINSLRAAVKMVEPYSQAHFADPAHCYGEGKQPFVSIRLEDESGRGIQIGGEPNEQTVKSYKVG